MSWKFCRAEETFVHTVARMHDEGEPNLFYFELRALTDDCSEKYSGIKVLQIPFNCM